MATSKDNLQVREKLVELIKATPIAEVDGRVADAEECIVSHVLKSIADHLIANGVTVQAVSGCEYCQEFKSPWDAPMIASEEDETDRGIYLYNGFLCANGGEFVDARVNYCPMCGRKLPTPPKGE